MVECRLTHSMSIQNIIDTADSNSKHGRAVKITKYLTRSPSDDIPYSDTTVCKL